MFSPVNDGDTLTDLCRKTARELLDLSSWMACAETRSSMVLNELLELLFSISIHKQNHKALQSGRALFRWEDYYSVNKTIDDSP